MVQKRGCILAMGVMNFMCLGLMYSWSKFSTEIRGELGFNHAEITVAYSICMAMFTIGILMDGILGRWWESKKCVLAGILLAAGGYFATSFVPPSQGSLLYVTYGPIVGFGIGVVYNEWLHNIIQWFPDRSGMASGLLLLGMGLSGVTTTPLMAEVSSVFGWRCSFRIIAIMILLSGLLARRYIKKAPENILCGKEKMPVKNADLTTAQMLTQPCFWTFVLWKLVLVGLGQACSGQLTEIIKDINGSKNLQLLAVSLFVACNGAARLIWGICCDIFGRVRTMGIISILTAAGTGLLGLSYGFRNLPYVMAALFIIALCYGGAAMLGANYIAAIFGKKYYRQNNGVSALTCLPVNLGATASIGLVRTIYHSYLPFFILAFPAAMITVVMSLLSGYYIKQFRNNSGGKICIMN